MFGMQFPDVLKSLDTLVQSFNISVIDSPVKEKIYKIRETIKLKVFLSELRNR